MIFFLPHITSLELTSLRGGTKSISMFWMNLTFDRTNIMVNKIEKKWSISADIYNSLSTYNETNKPSFSKIDKSKLKILRLSCGQMDN